MIVTLSRTEVTSRPCEITKPCSNKSQTYEDWTVVEPAALVSSSNATRHDFPYRIHETQCLCSVLWRAWLERGGEENFCLSLISHATSSMRIGKTAAESMALFSILTPSYNIVLYKLILLTWLRSAIANSVAKLSTDCDQAGNATIMQSKIMIGGRILWTLDRNRNPHENSGTSTMKDDSHRKPDVPDNKLTKEHYSTLAKMNLTKVHCGPWIHPWITIKKTCLSLPS